MKAIVHTKYGPPDILQLKEVEKPILRDNEVLIEVRAASVNYSDWVYMRGKPVVARLMGSGLFKPRGMMLGADVSAVCSTRNLDLVRPIGADHTIDYTRKDFTNNGQRYDLILDIKAYRSIFDNGVY